MFDIKDIKDLQYSFNPRAYQMKVWKDSYVFDWIEWNNKKYICENSIWFSDPQRCYLKIFKEFMK